ERLLSDEVGLVHRDDPLEPRFERVRRLVDVVALETELRLEAKRVARAEPDRKDAELLSGFEHERPHARRLGRGDEHLVAVLARVAGAREDAALYAAELALEEAEGRHVAD